MIFIVLLTLHYLKLVYCCVTINKAGFVHFGIRQELVDLVTVKYIGKTKLSNLFLAFIYNNIK